MKVYYQIFSENQVFNNSLLNTSFNQLYTFLINNLNESIVITELLIDGDVAKKMQNISTASAILTLDLITNNKSIFNLLKSSFSSLNTTQIQIENTTVYFVMNGFRFVMRYSTEPLKSTSVNGVFVKKFNI